MGTFGHAGAMLASTTAPVNRGVHGSCALPVLRTPMDAAVTPRRMSVFDIEGRHQPRFRATAPGALRRTIERCPNWLGISDVATLPFAAAREEIDRCRVCAYSLRTRLPPRSASPVHRS